MEEDYSDRLDLAVAHWLETYKEDKLFQEALSEYFPDFFATIDYLNDKCNEIKHIEGTSPDKKILIIEVLNILVIIKACYLSLIQGEDFKTIRESLINQINNI